MIVITCIFLAFLIGSAIGFWNLFEKAGIEGWKCLVPFYGQFVAAQLVGKSKWWIIYLFIPFINIFALYVLVFDFIKCFGKDKLIHQGAVVFFGFVFLPLIGLDKNVKYLGTLDKIPNRPKTIFQEWADAIIFAVVAATLIRWLIMEAYTIPTPSMENSLLVGDFLFVSKFHYGTRTPRTPLQIPLTHQKIWFTNIPSYLDWVQLPSYRLPGFTTVKRGDVVVFNVPDIGQNNLEEYDRSKWVNYPVDLKTNYIKRCVAISGDVAEVKNGDVLVNGSPLDKPPGLKMSYLVTAKDQINPRTFERLELDADDYHEYGRQENNEVAYSMFLTQEKYEEVKTLPYITSIKAQIEPQGIVRGDLFPQSKYIKWNTDFFGPLTVPKEGWTIPVNDSTLSVYGSTIRDYDHNSDVKIDSGRLVIDGKELKEYTFKQNYYFMMGDNRHNSQDSRYWGFVPEDHIVGKGFFIWLSIDKYGSYFNKIRWKRFFNLIR